MMFDKNIRDVYAAVKDCGLYQMQRKSTSLCLLLYEPTIDKE